MKYIKDINTFITDNFDHLLENLNISDNLYNALEDIDDKISNLILDVSENDYEEKPYVQDYIDFGDKRSYISFDNGKNQVKVGRFINQLIKKLKKENTSKKMKSRLENIKEKDIQSFVELYNNFLSTQIDIDNQYEVIILKGDELAKSYGYYGHNPYSTLGNSCMAKNSVDYFSIYSVNEDKISIATIWDNNEKWSKLLCRALLWETDNGIKIMDRLYYDDIKSKTIMTSWASKNGYAYREYESYGRRDEFVKDGKQVVYGDLEVSILNVNYVIFPYLDTFLFLKKEGDSLKLCNYSGGPIIGSLDTVDGDIEIYDEKLYVDYFYDGIENFSDVRVEDDSTYIIARNWNEYLRLFDPYSEEYEKFESILLGNVDHDIFKTSMFNKIKYGEVGVGQYWDILTNRNKKMIYSDIKRYYNLDFEEDKDIIDAIDNNPDLSDLKHKILMAYNSGIMDANENNLLDSFKESVMNFIGTGNYEIDNYNNVKVELDINKLCNLTYGLDIESFQTDYSGYNINLLDMMEELIEHYELTPPDVVGNEYSNLSKYINKSIRNYAIY